MEMDVSDVVAFESGVDRGGDEERAAVVAWLRVKAYGYHGLASSIDKTLNPIERAKVKSTELAYRFVQHAISRGDHISQEAK